jgi:MoaA/NifB/PqqE/SkfB family radical SAM enzyme
VTEDRVRRRLSLIHHVDDQIRRELVTVNRSYTPDGAPLLEEIVRVNFQCNQSCRFCFVSTHLPTAQEQVIREAIVSAATRGASVVLSGGEPTLNANLVEYVRLARAHSTQPVQLQTNAVLLDDPTRVRALVDAGLSLAFVSLHGSTAAVSDEVTQAPGTFVRSVVGLDHLVASGLAVVINFVICGTNAHELPALVHMIADRWKGAMLNISFVAPSTDVVPRDREMIPRYSDVMPAVAEAVSHANARGVRVLGFESMCGIPLCMVPGDVAPFFSLEQVPPGYDGGEFFYPPACDPCGLKGRCFGVRRGYAALHGTDEIRAVPAAG